MKYVREGAVNTNIKTPHLLYIFPLSTGKPPDSNIPTTPVLVAFLTFLSIASTIIHIPLFLLYLSQVAITFRYGFIHDRDMLQYSTLETSPTSGNCINEN